MSEPVVIVGAGFAGMYQLYRMREAGFDAVDFGGIRFSRLVRPSGSICAFTEPANCTRSSPMLPVARSRRSCGMWVTSVVWALSRMVMYPVTVRWSG